MASQGIFGRTVFPAIQTRVALTSHMLAFDMFKHPSLVFNSVITVSTSPYKASVSCSFLPHLHLNHRWKPGLKCVFQTVLSIYMRPQGISSPTIFLAILTKVSRWHGMFRLAMFKEGGPEFGLVTTVGAPPYHSAVRSLFQHFCLHGSYRWKCKFKRLWSSVLRLL